MLIIAFATSFRPGEATTPGPVIGNMNPTGLMGKASEIAEMPPGLYSFQESHLTSQGIRKFKQELSWCQTGYRICHGHPAPPKNDSVRTIGGRHTGTGVLTPYPCRPVEHHWSQEQYRSGRCHAAIVFMQKRWITVGTVYGFSERSHCLDVQQQTGLLLDGLTTRVVEGAQGMRVITGDWNQERQNLPQADQWEAMGWMEAQAFAQWRWSQTPLATCRRTTVKDYIYLSPEILPYINDVQLDWSMFTDHAVIKVFLDDLNRPPMMPMWRKPTQIPWMNKNAHQIPWETHAIPTQDMNEWYRRIWNNVEQFAQEQQLANNQPPLTSSQKGRGVTTEVKWTQEQIAPIKPNRRGDVQSALTTSSLQYSRWTRQLRRLQHYTRCASSESSATIIEHRACLWSKILRAIGFDGNFRTWWAKLPKLFIDSPVFLPSHPPGFDIANAVFLEFSKQYKALEASLTRAKINHAAQKRAKDPLQIYRDLQRERAEPVQTIVTTDTIQIQDCQNVGDGMTQLSLTSPIPQNLHSIAINGIQTAVSIPDPHHVVVPVESSQALESGIKIQKVEAEVTAVLHAFEEEWSPRWFKPEHEDAQQWETIVGFMKHAMPPRTTEFPPITAKQFTKAVAAKRKFAAIGPDGVSKQDILHMPPSAMSDLIALIECIEAGSPWPTQTVTGLVAALAKTPSAQTVGQYRPICIFSLVYRTWSSIRARQSLRYLMDLVPSTLMGNIPGRSPQKIWYHLQQLIEHSYCHATEQAGGVVDIVKCFNALPRHPLAEIAKHLGLPATVMRPWQQALNQMTRRFQVRGAVGRPLPSNRGYPEGCALSVVSMVVANITAELWMYFRFPSVRLWSFVDNIEATTTSAHEAVAALEALGEFCDLMDLSIDPCKTYAWSTSPSGRKQIVESQFHKKLFARDLGGHMCYSKLKTNGTIQDKIREFSPFWFRLARSLAPMKQKERALYVSAWPNIFYGVSTITLGNNHFQRLRSQSAKALHVNQIGANPELQLSCVGVPMADPELYSVLSTVMAFRNHGDPDLAQFTLQHLTDGGTASQGPCTSFLAAVHKLAWHWTHGDTCLDQHGEPIRITSCPPAELKQRVVQAWQQRILHSTEAIRTTMTGLANSDVRLTVKVLRSLPDDQQGLMRCALNGTQYTNDALRHAGVTDTDACRFCSKKDSLFHRTWQCSFFQDMRDALPDLPDPSLIPSSTACHGWLQQSPDLAQLRHLYMRLPDTTTEFTDWRVNEHLQYLDLFLDGSCVHPSEIDTRIASWAIVVWDGQDFKRIACGLVPGWRQTSLRAELTAAIAALKYAANRQCLCRLWFDNENVQNTLQQWIQGFSTAWEKKQDSDLWHQLHAQFRHSQSYLSAAYKVQAHAKVMDQSHPLDAWAVQGNITADLFAAEARQRLTQEFWTVWEKVRTHQAQTLKSGKALHSLFVQIGLRAQAATVSTPVPVPQTLAQDTTADVDTGIMALAGKEVTDFPKHLQVDETFHILQWVRTLTSESLGTTWVSYHQLLVDYQKQTHRLGPFTNGRKWTARGVDVLYNYPQQVQMFGRFLQNLAKGIDKPLQTDQRRPSSTVLAFWSGCLRVAIAEERLTEVDRHYRGVVQSLPVRQITRDMANVPPGFFAD